MYKRQLLLSTNQQWPQHQVPHDCFRFTSYGLRYCFERAGLAIERIEPMGGAFSVFLFQLSQIAAPDIWMRGARARRAATILMRPMSFVLRLLTPLASALDRLDRERANTLGWFVVARPADP